MDPLSQAILVLQGSSFLGLLPLALAGTLPLHIDGCTRLEDASGRPMSVQWWNPTSTWLKFPLPALRLDLDGPGFDECSFAPLLGPCSSRAVSGHLRRCS